MTKGFLILEDKNSPDGLAFEGDLFGAKPSLDLGVSTGGAQADRGYGEVVFNTSMTGYQEILTDPSYYGQIVCMTYPHIGNTGINFEDPESIKPWCAGFVVNELTDVPSNWRNKGSLEAYMLENGIPGIKNVDTRLLTRHLRVSGVVRGLILSADQRARARELLSKLPAFEGRDMIMEVTTREPMMWKSQPGAFLPGPEKFTSRKKVIALDFGAKRNLFRNLERLGCDIEIMPANTSAKEILAKKPDGLFLSNGPGDPAAATYAHESVRELIGKLPIFGVCMGHQILALALGAKTYKLKFGHRGANHPVLDQETGKVEISSQNHGYAVDATTMPKGATVTHLNLFDKTVAGLSVPGKKAFSVQYHPEACPGPHDSAALFNRFVKMMM
jgi:carbamoyl-phosphate synthase small subunit